MKRSLNVSVGFKLLLWCSVDLCLITFRCWLPWIWVEDGRRGVEVLAGSGVGDYFTHTHTHAHLDMHIRALALTYSALSSFLLSGSILTLQFARLPCVWKNRATFVPTFQMVSCGRLQCPYDCTVCRGQAETNGKANVRLISKGGEECAGEVRGEIDSSY